MCLCVCLCVSVRALKGKRLELSTPYLVHIFSMAVARHALTRRSKGQRSRSHGYENRHGCMVASDVCCCRRRGTACRMAAFVSSLVHYTKSEFPHFGGTKQTRILPEWMARGMTNANFSGKLSMAHRILRCQQAYTKTRL